MTPITRVVHKGATLLHQDENGIVIGDDAGNVHVIPLSGYPIAVAPGQWPVEIITQLGWSGMGWSKFVEPIRETVRMERVVLPDYGSTRIGFAPIARQWVIEGRVEE